MTLIELTLYPSKKDITINFDYVRSFSPEKIGTKISINDNVFYHVEESYKDIQRRILKCCR